LKAIRILRFIFITSILLLPLIFVIYSFSIGLISTIIRIHLDFPLSILGFIIGFIVFLYAFKKLKLKRNIEDTPTSKIRSIAMGRVEIKGNVVKRKKILSPFSKKECIYYKWSVEYYVPHRYRGGGYWSTLKKGEKRESFYLEDETGRVIVDPTGAKLIIELNERILTSLTPDIEFFLKEQRIKKQFRMRFIEKIWNPSDFLDIYIIGSATNWRPKHIVSPEFFNSGNRLEKEAYEFQEQDNKCIARIYKGSSKEDYLISDEDEEWIKRDLNWKFLTLLIGSPLFSLICLLYAIIHFKSFINAF